MSVVKREIKPIDLGIAEMRPRRAVTGAIIFEIAGHDASSKASRLAEKMAGALRDFPAKITVPRKMAELRVTGLEDSITPEVAAVIAAAGGGLPGRGGQRGCYTRHSPGPRLTMAALPVDSGKENRRRRQRRRKRRSRWQAPYRMVSGEHLPSPDTPTPVL
jgi:hypothetical protein